jgi:hypothetical protein
VNYDHATDDAKADSFPKFNGTEPSHAPYPGLNGFRSERADQKEQELLARAQPEPELRALVHTSRDWARILGHARATIDHQLIAATRLARSQLETRGVQGVADLRNGLFQDLDGLVLTRSAVTPVVEDDGALAVLEHACGYAREAGRSEASVEDWLDALFDRLVRTGEASPGLRRLRSHWVLPQDVGVEPEAADTSEWDIKEQPEIEPPVAQPHVEPGPNHTGPILVTIAVLVLGALLVLGHRTGWFAGSLLQL